MKYKCQVFRSTPLMLVVVCLSITSFPDTALIGNSKEPMQISVDSFQQAAFVPSGHGVVSWNESSRVRHRINSPSKLQIRGKDGAPFLFSSVPDGEKSAIDRMRRTASENGESSESFTFASLSLSFHDELSRLANIIKDFDSADSTKRERVAQLIYGLSNKKEYSDLIIPSLINQLEHPEKYESTLDTATNGT